MAFKLPKRINSFDDLPEKLRETATEYYEASGTGFVLLADVGEDKTKEFRESNIKLNKDIENYKKRFGNLEELPDDEIAKLLELYKKSETDETTKALKNGDVEAVLSKRTDAMRKKFETTQQELQTKLQQEAAARQKDRSVLKQMKIDNTLSAAVQAIAIPKPGALNDILNRGRNRFEMDDNYDLVPVSEDDRDPDGKPWTPDTIARHIIKEAPFLFEPSRGGGASGNTSNKRPGNIKVIPNTMEAKGLHAAELAAGTAVVEGA